MFWFKMIGSLDIFATPSKLMLKVSVILFIKFVVILHQLIDYSVFTLSKRLKSVLFWDILHRIRLLEPFFYVSCVAVNKVWMMHGRYYMFQGDYSLLQANVQKIPHALSLNLLYFVKRIFPGRFHAIYNLFMCPRLGKTIMNDPKW